MFRLIILLQLYTILSGKNFIVGTDVDDTEIEIINNIKIETEDEKLTRTFFTPHKENIKIIEENLTGNYVNGYLFYYCNENQIIAIRPESNISEEIENNCELLILNSTIFQYQSCWKGPIEINVNTSLQLNQFPSIVSISKKLLNPNYRIQKCIGIIIHPKIILTETNCIDKNNLNDYTIRSGIINLNIINDVIFQDRKIMKILKYPYRESFSLLILREPFLLYKNVQTICFLPNNFNSINRNNCYLIGWNQRQSINRHLLNKKRINIKNSIECQEKLSKHFNNNFNRFFPKDFYLCMDNDDNDGYSDGDSVLICSTNDNQEQYYLAGIINKRDIQGLHYFVNAAFIKETILKKMLSVMNSN